MVHGSWDAMKNRLNIKVRTDEVLRRMARRNMSRLDLAATVKSSKSYMTQILNGDYIPGPNIRSRIIKALGCSFDDVFFLTGDRTAGQHTTPDVKVQPRPRQAH